MIEKLRIFFIRLKWGRNSLLYRPAVQLERLIYFGVVQMTVTDQFAGEQQHRHLVAEARARPRIVIHVDDPHRHTGGRRQGTELHQHFIAEAAAGTGVQYETQWAARSLPLDERTE